MATGPVDRVATRPWVTPCQIAGAVPIRGERSEPVAIAPCFYLMATAVKPARPRTLAQLTAHPWVEEVSDERGMGQGIWVYLKPGHQWDGCHTIHEGTVGACLAQFATVEECPEPVAPVRPVLPGEATPPPAPSHGEAAPTLPELRADAAAGRPVSLSAVARAAQSEMAARRAARRAARPPV